MNKFVAQNVRYNSYLLVHDALPASSSGLSVTPLWCPPQVLPPGRNGPEAAAQDQILTLFIRECHCKGGDSRCPVSQNRGRWENCPGPLSHCELKRKEKRIVSRRKIQTRGKPPSQSLSTRAFLDLLWSSAGICGVLPPPSSLFPATSLVRPAPLHSQLGATLSIQQQPVSRAPLGVQLGHVRGMPL